MNNAIDLSIIIPMYNSEKYIEHAIQSVLQQKPHALRVEIIVVDDKSKDESCLVVERMNAENIILIKHVNNSGTAAARNTGLSVAKGQWIQFLDSDDTLSDEHLASLQGKLSPDMDCVICSAMIEYKDHFMQREIVTISDKRAIGYFYAVWNLTIRKDKVIPFKNDYSFEDVVFLFEMMCTSDFKIALLPNTYYHYNCTNTHSKMANFNHQQYRKMFHYLFPIVRKADKLTKMFFLETFVGILFSEGIPLSLSLPIAIKTLLGYFIYLPAVITNGVRNHVRNKRIAK